MKDLIKKVISRLNHCWEVPWINLGKTLLFNLLTLPIKDAVKLPVVIYGPCSIGSITGRVNLLSKAHYGMLKIGIYNPQIQISAESETKRPNWEL